MPFNWKGFGQRLALAAAASNPEVLEALLRGWLNRRLSLYTNEHLLYAIDHNVNLVSNMPTSEQAFLRGMLQSQTVRALVKKYEKLISTETVIKWWSNEHRPRGASAGPDKAWADIMMSYPGARNWLEIQLTHAKELFLQIAPA
jgi:hypothetical protein